MMTHAYSELYLDDAMDNLGDCFSYALSYCGYEADSFYQFFLQSEVASEWEAGSPRLIAGMSGIELVNEILYRVFDTRNYAYPNSNVPTVDLSIKETRSYWAGWALAYYQWSTGYTFDYIYRKGLTFERILSMYILHEADISKFVSEANQIIMEASSEITNLQRLRRLRGYSQKMLSQQSGVSLRMIQLYEQRQNDINVAAAGTVQQLAVALGCASKQLME